MFPKLFVRMLSAWRKSRGCMAFALQGRAWLSRVGAVMFSAAQLGVSRGCGKGCLLVSCRGAAPRAGICAGAFSNSTRASHGAAARAGGCARVVLRL